MASHQEDVDLLPQDVREAIDRANRREEPFATILRNGVRYIVFVANEDSLLPSRKVVRSGHGVWTVVNWRPLRFKPRLKAILRSNRIGWRHSNRLNVLPTGSGALHIRDSIDERVAGKGGIGRWSHEFDVLSTGAETLVTSVQRFDLESRFIAIKDQVMAAGSTVDDHHGANEGVTIVINQEKTMSIFDQRGQSVVYQYNDARTVTHGVNGPELIAFIEHLLAEVGRAHKAGAMSDEQAIDAKYQLEKAAVAGQGEGNWPGVIGYLKSAKGIVESIVALGGLAGAIDKAITGASKLLG